MATDSKIIAKAQQFHRRGFVYSEIQERLKLPIPKSTLFYWCRRIAITEKGERRKARKLKTFLIKARASAALSRRVKRDARTQKLFAVNNHLRKMLAHPDVAKVILGSLYLAEGSKGKKRSTVTFGNSDPGIIALFLSLFRRCYPLDEEKLHCTVQVRADQDVPALEAFWSKVTGISRSQFYTARIDPRTVGKKTLKQDYKGVCRIDYLSSDLFHDLMSVGEILTRNNSK